MLLPPDNWPRVCGSNPSNIRRAKWCVTLWDIHFNLNPFKAAGTAPQSMVADFLISQEDKNSELYQELETAMKAAAATVFMGGH
jgi:hypothetical protein